MCVFSVIKFRELEKRSQRELSWFTQTWASQVPTTLWDYSQKKTLITTRSNTQCSSSLKKTSCLSSLKRTSCLSSLKMTSSAFLHSKGLLAFLHSKILLQTLNLPQRINLSNYNVYDRFGLCSKNTLKWVWWISIKLKNEYDEYKLLPNVLWQMYRYIF
jgi:hypothetical protein